MEVRVVNRQEVMPVDPVLLEALAAAGTKALELIDARKLAVDGVPAAATAYLVDDVMIAEVHGQYMDDPTPTDVITFPYGETGEILVSVETAELQRHDYGNSWEQELALYLVHGLLHLCGHDDREEEERRRMEELQQGLVEEVFPGRGAA